MAGTGLPLPKRRDSLSQTQKLTPQINAARWSTASEWQEVENAARGLAGVGFGIADRATAEREAEEKRAELEARASYLAGQENEIAAKRIELHDKHAGDPDGFQQAWKGYTEGKTPNLPSWAIAPVTRDLGGAGNAAYASLLAERRATDKRLAAERFDIMVKRSADDVVGLAMTGQVGTPEFDERSAKLRATMNSAVELWLMSPEKADELYEDTIGRAHGEVATRSALQVYQEKGFDAATQHLRSSILENAASSLSPAQKQAAFNKGLAAIRLQKQVDGQDRAEFVAEATDMVAGLGAGQDVDAGRLSTVTAGLARSGAFGTLSKLQGALAIKQATAPLASLPPAEAHAYLMSLQGKGASVAPQLAQAESGGRPDAVNQFGYAGRYQFGAPRLADLGVYRPGQGENLAEWSKAPRDAQGKWSGEFQIPGFPQVKTLQDFLGNPQAQEAVMQAQVQKANQEIDARGLDRFLGKTVGGTVITRGGLVAMIHLGGPGSAQAFLESGGQTNPADANGKTVGDYARMGEGPVDRVFPQAGIVAKAVQSLYAQQMRKFWPDMKGVIERGHVVNPQDFAAVAYAAEVSGDADWKREIKTMAAAQAGIQAIGGGGVQQGQAIIDQATREFDADGVRSVEEDRVLKLMTESFDRKVKQVTESPVDYALANGAKTPAPLNFASPDAARAAVAERVNLARGVAQDQGVAPGSPFRAADRQAIAGAIAGPDPKQAQVAMDSLFAVPDQMLVPALSPEIRSAVQGAARGADPAKYGAAMSFLDKMWARAPETTAKMFGDDAMDAMQAWQQQLRYATPDQVAEQRMKALDPQVRARQKDLEGDGLKEARKTKPEDIAAAFDESWLPFNTPAVPMDENTRNAFMGDYDVLYSRFYAQTMDKDKAQQMAVERLKTKWGTSDLNGGRLMLNAPERHYPPIDGSHAWMRAELEAGLEKAVGKPRFTSTAGLSGATDAPPEQGAAVEAWTYELVADRTTQTESLQGRPPSYQVVITENGRANVLPQRVRWDTKAVIAAEERFMVERERQDQVKAMFDRNEELAKARAAQTNAYIQGRVRGRQ
jgi:hypothetical protein